jgi:hypothetical protein
MNIPELRLLRDSLMWHQMEDWARERAVALCDYLLAHPEVTFRSFRFNMYAEVKVTVETVTGPKVLVGKITGRVYREKHSRNGPVVEIGYWVWVAELESPVKTLWYEDRSVSPLK